MNESKTENKEISYWFDINNIGINIDEVVMIEFSEQNVNPITLHLKSGINMV